MRVGEGPRQALEEEEDDDGRRGLDGPGMDDNDEDVRREMRALEDENELSPVRPLLGGFFFLMSCRCLHPRSSGG